MQVLPRGYYEWIRLVYWTSFTVLAGLAGTKVALEIWRKSWERYYLYVGYGEAAEISFAVLVVCSVLIYPSNRAMAK
jgi:hypothetical protein